jgi:hypothetical protein
MLDDLDGSSPIGVDIKLEELHLAGGSGVDHLVERARGEGWDLSRSVSGDVTASKTIMTTTKMTTTTTTTRRSKSPWSCVRQWPRAVGRIPSLRHRTYHLNDIVLRRRAGQTHLPLRMAQLAQGGRGDVYGHAGAVSPDGRGEVDRLDVAEDAGAEPYPERGVSGGLNGLR